MAIEIKSIKGYYYLDAWVMSHIIYQATVSFCQRYLNKDNDPSGRLYDQMVMAARSAPANIAEGSSRRQTSRETEMRLTDVARATLSELLNDFLAFSLTYNIEPWPKDSENYRALKSLQLERPNYGNDIEHDAWLQRKPSNTGQFHQAAHKQEYRNAAKNDFATTRGFQARRRLHRGTKQGKNRYTSAPGN